MPQTFKSPPPHSLPRCPFLFLEKKPACFLTFHSWNRLYCGGCGCKHRLDTNE
jgi:hypothetical protein